MAQEEVIVAGQTAYENLEGDQLRNLEIGQLRGGKFRLKGLMFGTVLQANLL